MNPFDYIDIYKHLISFFQDDYNTVSKLLQLNKTLYKWTFDYYCYFPFYRPLGIKCTLYRRDRNGSQVKTHILTEKMGLVETDGRLFKVDLAHGDLNLSYLRGDSSPLKIVKNTYDNIISNIRDSIIYKESFPFLKTKKQEFLIFIHESLFRYKMFDKSYRYKYSESYKYKIILDKYYNIEALIPIETEIISSVSYINEMVYYNIEDLIPLENEIYSSINEVVNL